MHESNDPGPLNQQHGLSQRVLFDTARGGLTRAVLTGERGRAEVYLMGAHVTAFAPAEDEPVLFLSQLSHFAEGKPIRGGVPICFPWFAVHTSDPDAPIHGTVRTQSWRVLETWEDAGAAGIALGIATAAFEVRYEVIVDAELTLRMHVHNPTDSEQRFEQALHTYFRVGDIEQVTIHGLGDTAYFDKLDQTRKHQSEPTLSFTDHTDSVYQNTADEHEIHDPAMGRVIRIQKENARSTVVWNPWARKAATLDDLGDDEWQRMVCVEAGNVTEHPVHLSPGQSHSMLKRIGVRGL